MLGDGIFSVHSYDFFKNAFFFISFMNSISLLSGNNVYPVHAVYLAFSFFSISFSKSFVEHQQSQCLFLFPQRL